MISIRWQDNDLLITPPTRGLAITITNLGDNKLEYSLSVPPKKKQEPAVNDKPIICDQCAHCAYSEKEVKECRWDPKEFCGGILWQTGCGDFRHHGPETYCPKCGGEVEEVKETQ